MDRLLEKDIQKSILDYLALRRIVAWRSNSGTQATSYKGKEYWVKLAPKGTPDIVGYMPDGRFLGIEVKRPKGVVSIEQQEFLDKLNKSGGLGFVAYSLDDVIAKCG